MHEESRIDFDWIRTYDVYIFEYVYDFTNVRWEWCVQPVDPVANSICLSSIPYWPMIVVYPVQHFVWRTPDW